MADTSCARISKNTQRFPGLDTARAVLLLGGPVVHAASMINADAQKNALGHFGYELLVHASAMFRMQTFFLISGFLAASYLGKSNWRRNRVVGLALPLLAGCLIVLPVTFRVMQGNAWGEVMLEITRRQHVPPILHLWFLMSMLLCTIVFAKWQTSIDWLSSFLAQRKPVYTIILAFFAIMVTGLFNDILDYATAKSFHSLAVWDVLTTILKTPYYLCFYMLGYFVKNNRLFTNEISENKAWPICSVGIFLVAILGIYLKNTDTHHTAMQNVGRELWRPIPSIALSLSILGLSLRATSITRITRRFSDASYSIYLFHIPALGLVWFLSRHYISSYIMLFLVLSAGSFLVSWAIHELFVKPYVISQLIWNGKIPKTRIEVPDTAALH